MIFFVINIKHNIVKFASKLLVDSHFYQSFSPLRLSFLSPHQLPHSFTFHVTCLVELFFPFSFFIFFFYLISFQISSLSSFSYLSILSYSNQPFLILFELQTHSKFKNLFLPFQFILIPFCANTLKQLLPPLKASFFEFVLLSC